MKHNTDVNTDIITNFTKSAFYGLKQPISKLPTSRVGNLWFLSVATFCPYCLNVIDKFKRLYFICFKFNMVC